MWLEPRHVSPSFKYIRILAGIVMTLPCCTVCLFFSYQWKNLLLLLLVSNTDWWMGSCMIHLSKFQIIILIWIISHDSVIMVVLGIGGSCCCFFKRSAEGASLCFNLVQNFLRVVWHMVLLLQDFPVAFKGFPKLWCGFSGCRENSISSSFHHWWWKS